MNNIELLEIFMSPTTFVMTLSALFYAQFHLSYIFRLEAATKKSWKDYASRQSSRIYTNDWMAVDSRTGKLCGGSEPISLNKGISLGLVPEDILKGRSIYGQSKCSYFNSSFEEEN